LNISTDIYYILYVEKKDHYESWFVLIFYHKTENKARKTDPVARNTGTGSPRFNRNVEW
jgi:hypothetical protein